MSLLYELLHQCTVRISGQKIHGTGFFVAPGLILTCAHVVKDSLNRNMVEISWGERFYYAQVVQCLLELDVALLSLPLSKHPCVYLHKDVEPFDWIYSYGYTDKHPEGESANFSLEGKSGEDLKLKDGQVRPGLSGAPLLNRRTSCVCGMIQKTRDRDSALGGIALPIDIILKAFPELDGKQQSFHQRDHQWISLLKSDTPSTKDSRCRERLLKQISLHWIEGLLEPSLRNAPFIDLDFSEFPDAVDRPWEPVVQELKRPVCRLPAGTPIAQVYDDANGDLLILGTSGAGKTTLLLEICRYLLNYAYRNLAHPAPVVLHLATWERQKQPLAEWIIKELEQKYKISGEVGRRWVVEENKLLFLLDGLDEIAQGNRIMCISAINDFRTKYGSRMVVCCRLSDYEQIIKEGCLIQLNRAILVHPLTDQQINKYLYGSSGNMDTVHALLDRNPKLHALAEVPLMLRILTQTYEGKPETAISQLNSVQSTQNQLQLLGDAYVKRMLERRKKQRYYSEEKAISWLQWIAEQMEHHNSTVFYISWLQPAWLPLRMLSRYRWIYNGVLDLLFTLAILSGILGTYYIIKEPIILHFIPVVIIYFWSYEYKRILFSNEFSNENEYIQLCETLHIRPNLKYRRLLVLILLCISFIASFALQNLSLFLLAGYCLIAYVGRLFLPTGIAVSALAERINGTVAEGIIYCNLFSESEAEQLKLLINSIQIGDMPETRAQEITEMVYRKFDPNAPISKYGIIPLSESEAEQLKLLINSIQIGDMPETRAQEITEMGYRKFDPNAPISEYGIIKLLLKELQNINKPIKDELEGYRSIARAEGLLLIARWYETWWESGKSLQIDEQEHKTRHTEFLLKTIQKQECSTASDQGVGLSLRNGLLSAGFGILVCIALSLGYGVCVSILAHGQDFWKASFLMMLVTAGLFVITYGASGGLGACIQYYSLRFCLWLSNIAPLRYTRFLNYTVECILLRKVGGGYMFANQFLRDYFATRYKDIS